MPHGQFIIWDVEIMPVPVKEKKYFEKDSVDRIIDKYAAGDCLRGDVGVAAQVLEGIELYRFGISKMTNRERLEEHHNSARLCEFMEKELGEKKPERCHTHAIICGKHKKAAELRADMAMLGIGIDDWVNGVWLPARTKDIPFTAYKKAIPHSRIHRNNYFIWVVGRLGFQDKIGFISGLKMIAVQVQGGSYPPFVMENAKR